MAIYDEEKMKQKVIYPTKQTPSYADWALYNMGKDLEDKVDSIPASEPYTAGSGISISEENVISNTAQPDVNKAYVDTADNNLQQQIDGIVASTDVKDVVGTYAQLQAYDTTTLGNNDIVKVLQDSTHSDALTYYRWVITEGVGAWNYIGQEGPFYTKSQTDTLMQDKVDTDLSNVDVGQATAGQVLAVNSSANGVEWTDIVAGGYNLEKRGLYGVGSVEAHSMVIKYFTDLDLNKDYIIVLNHSSNNYKVAVIGRVREHTTSGEFAVINNSNSSSAIQLVYTMFSRAKQRSDNSIVVIGTCGDLDFPTELPTIATGDAGKVLAVNSAGSGVEWATPSGGKTIIKLGTTLTDFGLACVNAPLGATLCGSSMIDGTTSAGIQSFNLSKYDENIRGFTGSAGIINNGTDIYYNKTISVMFNSSGSSITVYYYDNGTSKSFTISNVSGGHTATLIY